VFGKGGAGKSTVTVLLAHGLAAAGYDTVVLDADSTNLGLSEALGADSQPDPLMDYFGGLVFTGGSITCPVDDPTPLADADLDLASLPRNFQAQTPDGIRLLVGGKMGELGPGAGCDGPIAKIARDVRVKYEAKRPLLIVDFKAGFEDSARGVLTGLDWILVVVDPTTAGVHMAAHLHRMWEKIRHGTPPATSHLEDQKLVDLAVRQFRECQVRGTSAILNRTSDPDVEAYMRGKLGALGGPPVLATLPENPGLQGRWLRGEEVWNHALAAQVRPLVLGLEGAVSSQQSMVGS
jgi:CO dehydrogenase nickel-insertion accessory protein CooC1